MLTIEKDIESYLIKKVEAAGGMCLKFPTIHTEGIPDRIVLLPKGKVSFVELKRPEGGRLSAIQRYQINKLKALGVEVHVIKDKDEVNWFMHHMTGEVSEGCAEDEEKCLFYSKSKGCCLPEGMRCQKEVFIKEYE